MIKWLFILLMVTGVKAQDLTPKQIDSLIAATWDGKTVYINDTAWVSKIEYKYFWFITRTKDIKYLVRRGKRWVTDSGDKYDIVRYYLTGIGWQKM